MPRIECGYAGPQLRAVAASMRANPSDCPGYAVEWLAAAAEEVARLEAEVSRLQARQVEPAP